MCGIVAAVAKRDVIPVLLEGLRKLEYRGYDSAGLAVLNGGLHRLRSVGRVAALADMAAQTSVSGHLGIAHTRWATHGAPTERNAHPHVSQDGLAVVHNGIIENHEEMRARLTGLGYRFASDTWLIEVWKAFCSRVPNILALLETVSSDNTVWSVP